MRIDLTGTNIEINGELRALVAKRFAKIKRRVPEDVHCEVILALSYTHLTLPTI